MDIEQLKLILETISAAGTGAFTFALLWLAKGVVHQLIWFALIVYIIKIKFTPFLLSWRTLQSIKDFMGFRGELTQGEADKILNSLKFSDDVITASGYTAITQHRREKILKAVRDVAT